MHTDIALERFANEVKTLDRRTLFRASLVMILFARPNLDVGLYEEKLEELTREAGAMQLDETSTIQLLFAEGRLRGNGEDYYDPRNSFLSDVLERKLGIPISLAAIGIAVGQRLDIDVVGVPFPGHFLLRVRGSEGRVIVDPFAGGALLSDEDLLLRMRAVSGRIRALGPDQLGAASPQLILERMLLNLKGIYLKAQDHDAALAIQERLVLVNPNGIIERRDRGLMYARAGRDVEAEADLVVYLDRAAGRSHDVDAVKRIAEQVKRNRGPAN